MKVLHVYAGNLYGGIERLLGTLARDRHLAPGMAHEFGLCFRGRLWDELQAAGVPVHDLGPVRFSRPWTVWRARHRLGRLLRRERLDVVMTHAAWPHAVFARTARRAGARLVNWVHDVMTGPASRFERLAGHTPPDVAVANSRYTAASVGAVFPGVRVEVLYLPVDPPDVATADPSVRRAVRAELRTAEADVVILQACRLERWKGHGVLVESLGRLRSEPGWSCWIAGGPQKGGEAEYLAELRTRAGKLGIADRVRFLGQRSDVPRLLAGADVVCQPNTGPEPFGIAFVEALYAGRPVVTTAVGGGAEVVTPDCGVLVPPGDPAAAADALLELIRDPARRAALGAAGPDRARSLCDPARQLAALAEILGAAPGRGE